MDELNMQELKNEELEGVSGGSGGSSTVLPPKAGCFVYQIQHGENLTGIARNNNTTVKAIMSVNKGIITNQNFIRAGFYIYIPN